MDIVLSALEQSLIQLPLVLGVHLSYRILNVTDLTVDGTYVLGAAVFARFIDLGITAASLLAIASGCLVGIIVALMQRKNIVGSLIVGILASFMLYSINLQLMGRPNISLLDAPNILNLLGITNWIYPLSFVAILVISLLILMLNSRFGLTLRAFGQNQNLLIILGKDSENYRLIGLMLSNALAALSGSLAAQVNGFADINMGIGVALISIGAVVIGGHIVIKEHENFSASKEILSGFIGIFLYFFCLSTLLRLGIDPSNLKLALGSIIFLSLRKMRSRRGNAESK